MLKKFREFLKDEPTKKNEVITKDINTNSSSAGLATTIDAEGNQFVNTYLALTADENILQVKKEVLEDEVKALPSLKAGEIDIKQTYIYLDKDEIEVSGFIRNGTESPISFNAVSLGIMDSSNNLIAQQSFPLGELGVIPPGGARPCHFRFSPENSFIKEFDQKECCIVFQPETNQTNSQTVNQLKLLNPPSWMSKEQLTNLERYIAQLPVVLEGEFNIAGLEARFVEGKGIDAVLIFRNGSKEKFNLGKMPLAFIDIEGNELAAGVFELSHITIDGHSAMILNLTFDKSLFTFEGEPDLSAWAVALMDVDNGGLAS